MTRYFCSQHKKLIVGAALSVLSLSAIAEAPREKVEVARQLVEQMDYKTMYEAVLAECDKSNTAYDPAETFKINPAAFGGISPQSAYWPEIEAAYRRYQIKGCKYISSDDVAAFLSREYAERMTLEDLKTSVAFNASPAGRRIQAASMEVNASFQAYLQESFNKVAADNSKDTLKEVAAIVAKYQRAPK